jgi:hypothetical protein
LIEGLTIDVVDYLLGATLYQASIKPPLGTIDVVDYLLEATLYQAQWFLVVV